MKSLLILVTSLFTLFSLNTWADGGTEVGFFFGAKSPTFKTDTSGVDLTGATGLMIGALAYGEMGGVFLRTGGYYTERKVEITSAGLSADLKISSIDVPVTLMYKFNDMFSAFGGALFALKLNDKCSGDATVCSSDGAKKTSGFYTAATAGLNAKFHPNWSGEVFYEYGLSDVSKKVEASAINLGVIFIY